MVEDRLKVRVYGLCVVGKTLGIENMLIQVKENEVRDIYNYTKIAYANTNGQSQVREMQIIERYQESVMNGKDVFKSLYEYCRDRIV